MQVLNDREENKIFNNKEDDILHYIYEIKIGQLREAFEESYILKTQNVLKEKWLKRNRKHY